MEILNVKKLSFCYSLYKKEVLSNISFSLERGDFVALSGFTGSGKSTLLRLIKKELRPEGKLSGEIIYKGKDLESYSVRESACGIGYVMQRPEHMIVTDKVWHELAFGLENIGIDSGEIRRRVSETACYFGIEDWFEKKVSDLSGGEKQLLSLASVMVMQPDILLLDEPTSQLDPVSASAFISTVQKLNRDFSLTVIMAEHRLEELIPVSDKLIVLEEGKIRDFGPTREVVARMSGDDPAMLEMPSASKLYTRTGRRGDCPLSIREGREYLEKNFGSITGKELKKKEDEKSETVLSFKDVFFRYDRKMPDVLRGLTFDVNSGEIFCVLGGNGSGKSTMLMSAAGALKPYAGQINIFGKNIDKYKHQSLYKGCVTYLPQDVETVFLRPTVKEELEGVDLTKLPFDVSPLMESHPYDLSGGQMQIVALAQVLANEPKILLMDEPTKGLDGVYKQKLLGLLRGLKASGMTIVIVSHDVEFCAEAADRCAMFFSGEVTNISTPEDFFSSNSFYTTGCSKMSRGITSKTVKIDDLVGICLGSVSDAGN